MRLSLLLNKGAWGLALLQKFIASWSPWPVLHFKKNAHQLTHQVRNMHSHVTHNSIT